MLTYAFKMPPGCWVISFVHNTLVVANIMVRRLNNIMAAWLLP